MNKPTQEQIESAKEVLRSAGYYVDNMWTIHDVLGMYDASDETAMDILDGALCNEGVIEPIFDCIGDLANREEFKEVVS